MKQLIIFVMLFAAIAGNAQDNKGTGPKDPSIRKEMSIRKQQRRDAKERRKREKEEQKAIKKHHERIQTKQVQKRMKTSKDKASRYNQNKREPFYKRWFQKKNRPSKKKSKGD